VLAVGAVGCNVDVGKLRCDARGAEDGAADLGGDALVEETGDGGAQGDAGVDASGDDGGPGDALTASDSAPAVDLQPAADASAEAPESDPDALLPPGDAAPDARAGEDVSADGAARDGGGARFCDSTDRDLAACYRFEGNVRDESRYAQDTSATDVSYEAGVAGQAVHTRSGSAITVAESSSLDFTIAMTLELWVRPSRLPSGDDRAGLIDNDGQYGLFLYADGDVICTASSSGPTAPQALVANRWTHLACVFDGSLSTVRLYVDGELRASEVVPLSTLMTSPSLGLTIGRNNPSGDSFTGEIDGLRLWRVARPPELLCTTPASCG